MPNIRAHAIISGRVQGVFFRSTASDMAKELGLGGWVRNLEDGGVEAVFEGDESKVREMLEWCKKGPRFAEVSRVDVEFGRAGGEFKNFEIRH